MTEDDYLSPPKPSPDFTIPASSSTVEVRVIDTGTLLHINPSLFWEPAIRGFDGLYAPIYCFLISHGPASDRKQVVFDLGLRRNWRTYAPKIVTLIEKTTEVRDGEDVASVLDANAAAGREPGVRSTDVSAVVWSHNHFDHVGDPATFPPHTDLVVGPGVREASWPGWPSNPDGAVLDSDAAGRTVRGIRFTGPGEDGSGDGEGEEEEEEEVKRRLKIGRFDAYDYFGDGSFYLLDAPGHAVGHMCALARTTANPPSFVFMGADACHHAGVLRPTEWLPLPRSIRPSPLKNDLVSGGVDAKSQEGSEHKHHDDNLASGPSYCPGELLQQLTSIGSATKAFFEVTGAPVFLDREAARDTVTKIHELDARDDVFVILAHDLSLRDRMPLFPDTINAWKAKNLRTETRWLFCSDFEKALTIR